MCMYSRVFSLNLKHLKNCLIQPKKNITQPKNSSYQTTPDYNNLVESNIFRSHHFFIEILFCQEFRLAEFRLISIIKNSNIASKMTFFISKFMFLFIFTGGYLRKDRLSGRQTICLISTSLEL